MCYLEEVTTSDKIAAGPSTLNRLIMGDEFINRLGKLTRQLKPRAKTDSTTENSALFDRMFKSLRLQQERHAHESAVNFWGYRNTDLLDEFLVEATSYAFISKWRLSSLASRHQHNVLFEQLRRKRLPTVLCDVVEHLRNCPRTLAEIALDDNATVRVAVSENMFTDLRTMFLLAGDSNADVRFAIAENHNAPIAALQFLSEDENPYVSARAQRTLSRLITNDVHTGMLERLSKTTTRRRATA